MIVLQSKTQKNIIQVGQKITDHLCRKTNALLNLIKQQDNYSVIDKIHLHFKDLNEAKHQYLIKNGKTVFQTNQKIQMRLMMSIKNIEQ